MSIARLAAPLLALLLAVTGCSGQHGGHAAPPGPELVVGSKADPESRLLASLYVSALRSYGFPARAETADDPMAKLDSGEFTVVPAFTGQVLHSLQPDDSALSDKQVYKAMNAALPEGIASGDYTTAAEDKPALVVTPATGQAWGGQDLSADLTLVQRHCDGLTVGIVKGGHAPAAVGSCKMPRPREFPNDAALFAALRSNELTAAWTTTANPGIPGDLVVLADASKNALIRAENVVPLYRRNALTTRQLLAINEVAGVLDTEALTDLWRKVAGGADPQAVADGWLGEHPLGR